MKLKLTVKDFTERFAIMKVGIEGYEDEIELWKLPTGCKPTFCHIMVRVDAEHKRAKENGELKYFVQYPFLISRGAKTVFESYSGNQEAINIYFIPVKNEIEDWCYGFPDPSRINWAYDGELSRIVIINREEYQIPKSIRLGDPSRRDQVLLINNLECFEECGSVVLDFSGSHCRKISSLTPIEKFLKSRESFGVFKNCKEAEECKSYRRCVVARAKLEYPYMGYTKITSKRQ
jgi:hypothetical protein